ncbi:putative arginase [Ancylostoma ceylanicum]|uniref:Arginase n=1 Tax=Ancylostoma ceylanicum TaxID=53326 RepID=A0A0D6M8Z2_9BILA|nr:putative arginase [Ancylostoma ceylanicum]
MKRTMRLAQQFITAIGCANGNGGRHLGCEHAVKILRNSKFLEQVRVPIQWKNVVEEVTTGRHFEALAGVTQTCKELAFHTRNAIENKEELLVLGGDHSCAMGTWSGVASAIRPYGDLGLIWVDAHMDAHTPGTTPSGNLHGMPVAHLLGYGDKNLTSLGDKLPKILPHNMCMVGIRSYEEGEQELLERLGVRIFYMDEVDRRGIAEVMQEAQYLVTRNTIGFGMSIDIDGFDTADAPAVGTPEENGISANEFLRAVLTLDLSKLLATEIVEFMPGRDDEHKSSERLVVNLMEAIYLTKFFQQNTTIGLEQRMQARA